MARAPVKSDKSKPKLPDCVREAIRIRHYSMPTEESYVNWIRRFIRFHNEVKKDVETRSAWYEKVDKKIW